MKTLTVTITEEEAHRSAMFMGMDGYKVMGNDVMKDLLSFAIRQIIFEDKHVVRKDKLEVPAENILIHDDRLEPVQSVFLHPFNVEVIFASEKAAEGSSDKDCLQIHVRDNVTGKQTIVYEITK